jgi:hypothetical protein
MDIDKRIVVCWGHIVDVNTEFADKLIAECAKNNRFLIEFPEVDKWHLNKMEDPEKFEEKISKLVLQYPNDKFLIETYNEIVMELFRYFIVNGEISRKDIVFIGSYYGGSIEYEPLKKTVVNSWGEEVDIDERFVDLPWAFGFNLRHELSIRIMAEIDKQREGEEINEW